MVRDFLKKCFFQIKYINHEYIPYKVRSMLQIGCPQLIVSNMNFEIFLFTILLANGHTEILEFYICLM